MLIGLKSGKLNGEFSRPLEEIEDLLTSVVFGSLQYVPVADGLLPFIGCAKSPEGGSLSEVLVGVRGVKCEFWPRWDAPVSADSEVLGAGSEPEIVLRFERDGALPAWVLVEAKLWSGKSSRATPTGPVNDQLGKYWVAFEKRARDAGAEALAVVYVTRGVVPPEGEFEDTQRELASKHPTRAPLFWLSWRHFEQALRATKHRLLRDVRDLLLERWHLSMPDMTWSWPARARAREAPTWQFDEDWAWPADRVPTPTWSFTATPTHNHTPEGIR